MLFKNLLEVEWSRVNYSIVFNYYIIGVSFIILELRDVIVFFSRDVLLFKVIGMDMVVSIFIVLVVVFLKDLDIVVG